jgi:hypothetical protein
MKIVVALCSLFLFSCASTREFKTNMKAVEKAAVLKSFKNVVEGVNDSYFEIKENNYFDSYRLLFDSVKNTRYAGTYTSNAGNDTIALQFFKSKGQMILGSKAVIKGKNITFFK